MTRLFAWLVFSLCALCPAGMAGAVMQTQARPAGPPVKLGIDVLEQQGFAPLRGKRVGLLTHPAGVNRYGVSTIDVLRRSGQVRLVALYGPEHGIYGDEKANVKIGNRTDRRTGLPVYSLYGEYRKPTPEMLRNIDVMVVDLQDLGSRSYTYVSCMLYTMEACFEQGKQVIVLDRPNPLGGLKVDGPFLEEKWRSYVGAFPAPYVHGLTVGEIARIAKDTPGWLRISETARRNGRLSVIAMQGWKRSMLWQQTGLTWVPTSPAVPNTQAAFGYAMVGLGCQLGGFQHGYGTPYPFRLLTYPTKTPQQIADALNARNIPGLSFSVRNYRASNGQIKSGAYVSITNWEKLHPVEVSYHLQELAARWSSGNPFAGASGSQENLFNKHFGDSAWWDELRAKGGAGGLRIQTFHAQWDAKAYRFQAWSRTWWLYR